MKKIILGGQEWTILELADLRGREEEFFPNAVIGVPTVLRMEDGTRTSLGIWQQKTHEVLGIIIHDTASGENCMKEAQSKFIDHDIKEILKEDK